MLVFFSSELIDVGEISNTGENLAFEELEGSTATSRDVANFLAVFLLLNEINSVTTSDDGSCTSCSSSSNLFKEHS